MLTRSSMMRSVRRLSRVHALPRLPPARRLSLHSGLVSGFSRVTVSEVNLGAFNWPKAIGSRLYSTLSPNGSAPSDLNAVDEHGNTQLMVALYNKDFEGAKRLVEAGADVNVANKLGFTALAGALVLHNLSLAEYLIQRGAKIDVWYDKVSMFGHMVLRGFGPEARLLLKHGARLDDPVSEDGWCAFHYAVQQDLMSAFNLLLELGADPNVTEVHSKITPLYMACTHGRTEMVRKLLSHGAKHDMPEHRGFTPLHAVARFTAHDYPDAAPEITRLLLDAGADMHKKASDAYSQMTPFENAVLRPECESVLRVFLEYGADVNACDHEFGRVTILGLAVHQGHRSIVRTLLSAGASPTVKTRNPLLSTVQAGYVMGLALSQEDAPFINRSLSDRLQMMEELIKLGADVNATSDIPDSGPLHVACCYGLKEFFDILVANGASIRDYGPGQRTLLMLAAEGGNVEILEELWKTGGFGLNDKDDHNRTAVWYAVASGRREAFSWFVSRGCDLTIVPAHNQTMMHAAAVGGSVELIDDLVAHGFDVNAVNSDGERPIHAAAFANQTSAICKFVALNVSVNERGERQQTPLHTAAERGMISACDTLIKLGADVNAVDSDGNTPLHLLVEAAVTERVPKEYAVTLAGVFAEHGADIDRVNNEGRSPLLRLMEHGSQEMVTAIALIRKYKTREAAKKAVEEEPPGSDTPLHIRAVLELLMARGFKGPGV